MIRGPIHTCRPALEDAAILPDNKMQCFCRLESLSEQCKNLRPLIPGKGVSLCHRFQNRSQLKLSGARWHFERD
jgi:hypothetical protein